MFPKNAKFLRFLATQFRPYFYTDHFTILFKTREDLGIHQQPKFRRSTGLSVLHYLAGDAY